MHLAAVLVIAAGVGIGCGGDSPTESRDPEPTPNFVRLVGEPGEPVTAGGTYEYTQANARITVTAEGNLLVIDIGGYEEAEGRFQLPAGTTQFQPGTYVGLTRHELHEPARGGVMWSMEDRECFTLTGSITVDSATYLVGKLKAIDMHFEQYCEGSPHALRGTIHWRADDRTVPAGPIAILPTLWSPPPGAMPGSGNAVFLQSDAYDFVGLGGTYFYGPTTPMTVTPNWYRLSVAVGGWFGEFEVMRSLGRLEPGFYGGLTRYPFHDKARGGLSWWGQSRGCNELTGWFAVDHVVYEGSELAEIDLRFEQHCEAHIPALRGAIRWRR